eukprot:1975259-Prymnesium_polylepis.3
MDPGVVSAFACAICDSEQFIERAAQASVQLWPTADMVILSTREAGAQRPCDAEATGGDGDNPASPRKVTSR